MATINLGAIRRRFEAATAGTWKVGSKFGCGSLGSAVAVISGSLPPIELDHRRNGRADAAFIAHAHQDVPALLAEVDRLRARLEGSAMLLRQAAEGRLEYLAGCPNQKDRDVLETEASTLRHAASVVEGDLNPMYGWLPSWRWSDEMTAAARSQS